MNVYSLEVPKAIVGSGLAIGFAAVVQSIFLLVGFKVGEGFLLEFTLVNRIGHACAGGGFVDAGKDSWVDSGGVELGMVVPWVSSSSAIYILRRGRRVRQRLMPSEAVNAWVQGWDCGCLLTTALKSRVGNQVVLLLLLLLGMIQGQGGNRIHRPCGRGCGRPGEASITSVDRRLALGKSVLKIVLLVSLIVSPMVGLVGGPLDVLLLHVMVAAAAVTAGV